MKNFLIGAMLAVLAMSGASAAQKDKDDVPTSWLNFVVLKEDNGKPVRNAAVIMHPVSDRGKQQKGGMELKSDTEGKCNFDGIPYGKLRVQVLAQGFQTYGEDFDVDKPKMEFTIKLKRPQTQFSVYDDHANTSSPPKTDTAPEQKKPN
ncbi:MAG TPA: carboxypeptidase-like regulatory domain-containing protein [Candidatus Solibacter sp.]|nr:carboxypeptidase-like regulatory domain-containing protein [Candidatus Solibacter sp.]